MSTKFHTVKKGETLESIAQSFGTSAEEIDKLNELQGDEPQEGTSLLVPGASDKPKPDAKEREGELLGRIMQSTARRPKQAEKRKGKRRPSRTSPRA